MGTDKVVEEDEHGNEVVGRSKRGKALFGLVPSLKLLVEALDKVVGDIIVEALHADMPDPMQCLNGHLVGKVAVTHNGLRSPHSLHSFQYGKSLRTVPVAVEVKAENKAGFTVQDEPEVVFLALNLHHGFIGVPLVRVEVQRRKELYGNVLKHGGEASTPVADGRVRYPNIHHCP